MKLLIFICLVFNLAFAEKAPNLRMECGEVLKVRSAKLLRRLEPSLFGLNTNIVLLVKLKNAQKYTETHYNKVDFVSDVENLGRSHKSYLGFSNKSKYKYFKKTLSKKLRSSRKALYACTAVSTLFLKYYGSDVFWAYSYDKALELARKNIRRRLK